MAYPLKTTHPDSKAPGAKQFNPWRFCIAPMMDLSDQHARYMWRLLSKHARLYTEMINTGAILHGDKVRFLQYNPEESPLALQLGGSDPSALAECAGLAEQWGYAEVNLNCGCPSDRVQAGKIGACLMAEPELVAECVEAMRQACGLEITVKHRIGIDDCDDYDFMHDFVTASEEVGCKTFIVHARKAWLKGLSPKQNREIPPLLYENVFRLKQEKPQLNIVINGGISTLSQCQDLLEHVDGVMVGREAYYNPYCLAEVDASLFEAQPAPIPSRIDIFEAYAEYCKTRINEGVSLHHMTRHILGLFSGQPGARLFRRFISENTSKGRGDAALLDEIVSRLKEFDAKTHNKA